MGREVKGLRVYLNDRERLLVDKVGHALGITPSKAIIFGFLKYIDQVTKQSQQQLQQMEALDATSVSHIPPAHEIPSGDNEECGLPASGGGEPGQAQL